MAAPQDFALDRALVRRRFGAAAARPAGADVLARELARRMDERLDYIRFTPRRILDLGCGAGEDLALLAKRYPQAERIGADFALPMLAEARRRERAQHGLLGRLLGRAPAMPLVGADATALPLASRSVSMVWSNLMLNWLTDPLPALKEMHRVLEVGGMVMFSTLGPDTLQELRAALPDAAGERVHRFIDMHDIGDALVQAGFSDPVMDMEMLTLTYADFDALLADLRLTGCANAAASRPRGLSGRRGWTQARERYETLRRDGRLPATFEVIQGHAWKAEPKTTEDGRAIVRFQPRAGKAG
ncbi:methyltransferase domain-containing protein [Pseudothauera rhizosphaerae]|uniref:Malonyl-[acyl-carrier protein] O-methyltransferase n=1 Tax=Pseudothauera rhizosphaerae TaxID=2565932 RepID=A0A4S4ANA9_9RHOO|nr:methyltransferase domain-containing protein [Pseudothauera rhizosphaerae]THF60692.1 methyltransferase domain-containing protein [Pseudothauera rhizosphaerae]